MYFFIQGFYPSTMVNFKTLYRFFERCFSLADICKSSVDATKEKYNKYYTT